MRHPQFLKQEGEPDQLVIGTHAGQATVDLLL